MPQLIIAGIVVAGGWLAMKLLKSQSAAVGEALEEARRANPPTDTLTKDPTTGRYKLPENGSQH